MDAITTQITELLHKEPFTPFKIILTSGKEFEVTVPTLVAISESLLFYCFPKTDRFVYARLTQINAIEAMGSIV